VGENQGGKRYEAAAAGNRIHAARESSSYKKQYGIR